MLPILPLDTQHIGSDGTLAFQPVEDEPQPDNPSRLSPFTDATQLAEQANRNIFSRTRVQMKVQDGCDNRCTYCIVPYVRGKSRSRSIEFIVEHVNRKVRAGYQEIVLTGIHLGDFHPDEEQKLDLDDLISTLLHETEMPRIRVSSLRTRRLPSRVARIMAEPTDVPSPTPAYAERLRCDSTPHGSPL